MGQRAPGGASGRLGKDKRGVSPSLEAGGLQWKRVQGTCSFRKPGKGALEGEPQADIGRWSTNCPRRCEPMPASAGIVWGPGGSGDLRFPPPREWDRSFSGLHGESESSGRGRLSEPQSRQLPGLTVSLQLHRAPRPPSAPSGHQTPTLGLQPSAPADSPQPCEGLTDQQAPEPGPQAAFRAPRAAACVSKCLWTCPHLQERGHSHLPKL